MIFKSGEVNPLTDIELLKGAFDDADDILVFGDFGAEGFFHFRLGGFGLVVDFVKDNG